MKRFITSGPGYGVVVSVPWMRANICLYIIFYSFYYLRSSYIFHCPFHLKCMFYNVLDFTHTCTCGRFCVNLSSIKQRQQVNASEVSDIE